LQANMRDRLLDFLGFRPNARALERMDPRSLAHRERQPLRARRRFRRRRFAHPKEPRHRRALAIVRLQHDPGRRGLQHPQRTLACRPRYQSNPRNAPLTLRTEQPCGQARARTITAKGFAPLSFAVSMVVLTSASAWAAHMARYPLVIFRWITQGRSALRGVVGDVD